MSRIFSINLIVLVAAVPILSGCANNSSEISSQTASGKSPAESGIIVKDSAQNISTVNASQKIIESKRTINELDPIYVRNHWQEFITVTASRPDELNAPGLYDKKITAINKLPYLIDSIIVLATYFNGSDCIAGVPIRFANIREGETISMNIPDNSQARTFQYQVRKVICRKANLCFNIDERHEGDDPFLCR